jgi:hypothetical protein
MRALPHSTPSHSTLSSGCLCRRPALPRVARPRRFAGHVAHGPGLRCRRGLCRAAALQPARAQQRLRRPRALASAIGEAHAAGRKLTWSATSCRTTARCAATWPTWRRSSRSAGRADHGRPRADRPGSRDLAGDAGPPLGAGQYRQLCGRAFWQKLGITRIILSRELSLDEVAEIRQECPDIELEVFVHGALCIAYSGRCLLSGYFNHRDPNQGTCTNSCRWDYKLTAGEETRRATWSRAAPDRRGMRRPV